MGYVDQMAEGLPVGLDNVADLASFTLSLITWEVSLITGEVSAFMPVTGGFVRHATKFVQPAFGVAAGFNFCTLHPDVYLQTRTFTNSTAIRVHSRRHNPRRALRGRNRDKLLAELDQPCSMV